MNCLLCHSTENKVLYRPSASFDIVRCKKCGLVYNSPQLLMGDVDATGIYTSKYYNSTDPTFGYEDYLSSENNLRITFEQRLCDIEKKVSKGALLDVGCATGFFLDSARIRGWQVYGVDASIWASDYARKNLNLNIITGFFGKINIFEGIKFDVVTMWDLIEQVPDPRAMVREACRLLKDSGLLVLFIRDIDSFMARRSGSKWIHLRPREKYVYFSPGTIRQLLESEGFEILDISTKHAGKLTSLHILFKKLENYNRNIARFFQNLVELAKWSDKAIYLNFLDTKVVYAKKKC